MDIQIYAIHVVPFVIIVYFAFVLFLHPPKAVILASLAGGLVMAVINALADLLAYYASWWHYTASGLILQLPLPFYLTPMLIYGGVAYMLVWRFGGAGQAQGPRLSTQPPLVPTREARFGGAGQAQGPHLSTTPPLVPTQEARGEGRGRWLALAFLVGVPLLGFARDLLDAEVTHASYLVWDSTLAGPIDFVLWLAMFYAGYAVFRLMLRNHPARQSAYPVSGKKNSG